MWHMSDGWRNKRIAVTGGTGFVGSNVVEHLVATRGVDRSRIAVLGQDSADLRVLDEAVRTLEGADVVFHVASDMGGLAYSRSNGASQYYNSSLIDLHILEAARRNRVGKVVAISCSTAYPESALSPLTEDMLFAGSIRPSHLGTGTAKRNLVTCAGLYADQYGLDVCVLIPNNVFGPRDDFDPEKAHVIPATIHKCLTQDKLVVWGDGTALRDFLYVEDLAEAAALAVEGLPAGVYVNVGSGVETSIRELVETIAAVTGFGGTIEFDESKPSGDPRRSVSIEQARELLLYEPHFTLEEGLHKTVDWYRSLSSTSL